MRVLMAAGLLWACAAWGQPKPGEGTIEGRVANALTGAPIRRATVVLTGGEIRLVAETDSEGRFDFAGLPAGSYRLTANRSGFLERRAPRLIAVGEKERAGNADIHLQPQGVIAGRVLDETGEPADRARVWLLKQVYRDGRRTWDPSGGTSQTNDRGEYRFSSVKPGRYILRAFNEREPVNSRYGSPPGGFSAIVYYPSAMSEEQASSVEVSASAEIGGIDIQLVKETRAPPAAVRGRVTGLPADSPMVVSVGIGSGSMTVRAPDFAFAFHVLPGQYVIRANEYATPPTVYGSEGITVTGDISGIAVPLRPAPVLTGRIRVAEEGARVKLEGIGVSLTALERYALDRQDLLTDASGRFVSGPLRPMRYGIAQVRGLPAGCYIREMRIGGREIAPADFEVATSGTLEIVLSTAAGRIAGSVVDAEGKVVAGPTVTLIPQDGRSWPAKMGTDESGGFQFSGLRPGKYTLFAWEEPDDDLWQDPEYRKKFAGSEVEVKAGETQRVEVRAIGQ